MAAYEPTMSYRLIYIFAIHDKDHEGYLKIGDTTFDSTKSYKQLPPNCEELNQAARDRIDDYTKTAMVAYDLQYTELARFYAGYGYYLNSPEAKLDQSGTYKAIDEMQRFLDYFPHSERAKEAQDVIFELQDKLVYKELLNSQLYYNLGNYMGNNYQSAVITAQNAIKEYPYSKYKEALSMIILKAKFQEASQSVYEKKADRFRDVIDEYYSFINDYPDGPNAKEAKDIFRVANKYVKE